MANIKSGLPTKKFMRWRIEIILTYNEKYGIISITFVRKVFEFI